jgi:menaquinone-9 beta-reductase
MRRTDPLIIGGGPAGSAAAIMLARSGAKPLILERQTETGDAICGGFLSWQTLKSLKLLGLGAEALGGHPVTELRLFAGNAFARAPLPGAAIGLSRRRMDGLLIDQAQAEGAALERGVTVREIGEDRTVRLGDGAALSPDSLFLATGKHDLRGVKRDRSDADIALGLRLRLPPHPALTALAGGAIELQLFDRGYCGLVLQEDGSGNLCMAVRKSRLAEADGDPLTLFQQIASENPAFADRMAFAARAPMIDAISAVPYGWVARDTVSGLFKLGDQAAVIPSLAGEGNGIALASGIIAAKVWGQGGSATDFQSQFAVQAVRPIRIASLLWHLGERPTLGWIGTRLAALVPRLAGHFAGQTRIRY